MTDTINGKKEPMNTMKDREPSDIVDDHPVCPYCTKIMEVDHTCPEFEKHKSENK